jgi:hypothetical protein
MCSAVTLAVAASADLMLAVPQSSNNVPCTVHATHFGGGGTLIPQHKHQCHRAKHVLATHEHFKQLVMNVQAA